MCRRTTVHYTGCGHTNEMPVIECSQANIYPFSRCEKITQVTYAAEARENRICRVCLAELGRAVLELMEIVERVDEGDDEHVSRS